MTNGIDRSAHSDIAPCGALSFLQTHNADRDSIYGHLGELEESTQQALVALFGDGTLPDCETTITLDSPAPGQMTLAEGYGAIIGSAFSAPQLTQAYTTGVVNYVFLGRATDGSSYLDVKTTDTAGDREVLIATVDATGETVTVNMSPATKPWCKLADDVSSDNTVTKSSALTTGGILYSDLQGEATEDSANLYYDDTGPYIGVANDNPAFAIDSGGDIRLRSTYKLYFGGTGSADNDVNLYRESADELKTDDSLTVGTDLKIVGNVGFFDTTPVTRTNVSGPAVFLNTDSEIGSLTVSATYTQSEIEALRDKCEELADDCRSLRETVDDLVGALQSYGLV